MNIEQHNILRHALGLSNVGMKSSDREYRNHFVTGPGSTDYPHCEALVSSGLMTKHPGHALTGGDPTFVVTDEGKTVARSKTPNVGAERAAEGGPVERPVGPL